jgi:acyl-CoA thioesterase II
MCVCFLFIPRILCLLQKKQCYFLTAASAVTPIVYQVDRLRDGTSYVTRGVRALQNGRTVFIMVCSFHKPEPWQPSHQWKMPDVPPPEQCESDEEMLRRFIRDNSNSPTVAQRFHELLIVSLRNLVLSS